MSLRRITKFPPLEAVKKLDQIINGKDAVASSILEIKTTDSYRPQILAPFSFFSNKSGHSSYKINGNQYHLETDTILVMNRGEEYDLMIDNSESTIIQNMHINEAFLKNAYSSFISTSKSQLDNIIHDNLLEFRTGIFHKTNRFQQLLNSTSYLNHFEEDNDEGLLMMITDELFMNNHTVLSTLSNQKSISQSIKQELFEKIMKAKDFIWCNYSSPLNITTIASEIGMSKYHFLRVFKTFTGLTPYQFLKSIRHQKACSFLTNNNLSIYEIADKTGFENASSFIKSFHKIEGIPPEKYRKK